MKSVGTNKKEREKWHEERQEREKDSEEGQKKEE